MAVSVTIVNPAPGASVSLPLFASVTAIDDSASNIVAAWFHVDAGDSINIPVPTPATSVSLSFTIDGVSTGPHLLSVYARTVSSAGASDQNFNVVVPPTSPPPLLPPPF